MLEVDELEMAARVDEILNRHPAVGLAVGVVRDGRLEFFHGHGLADIASNTPITEDTVFRIALHHQDLHGDRRDAAVGAGAVDLDAPANDYLRAYRLIPAQARLPAGDGAASADPHRRAPRDASTPRGVLRPVLGESVTVGRPVPYARRVLPRRSAPGRRAGHQVHLQQPRVRHARPDRRGRERAAARPLLPRAHLRAARHGRHRPRPIRAGPAAPRDGIRVAVPAAPSPVTDRELVTVGGGAIYSTPRDMARYVAALLGGGANEHGSVLKPATLAMHVRSPTTSPIPACRVSGSAFFRRDLGGHLVVEHDGMLPGFNSQIFAGPRRRRRRHGLHQRGQRGACCGWRPRSPGCSGSCSASRTTAIRDRRPAPPRDLGRPLRLVLALRPGSPTRRRGDARRRSRGLRPARPAHASGPEPRYPRCTAGFPLHPDDDNDPYVFRIDLSRFGIGTAGSCSAANPAAADDASPPRPASAVSFDKQPASQEPAARGSTGSARRARRVTAAATAAPAARQAAARGCRT